jgi:hypothetical protein
MFSHVIKSSNMPTTRYLLHELPNCVFKLRKKSMQNLFLPDDVCSYLLRALYVQIFFAADHAIKLYRCKQKLSYGTIFIAKKLYILIRFQLEKMMRLFGRNVAVNAL